MKPSLAHDADPEAFGLAVELCQGYTPECSASAECQYDGFCFTRNGGALDDHARLALGDEAQS